MKKYKINKYKILLILIGTITWKDSKKDKNNKYKNNRKDNNNGWNNMKENKDKDNKK